MSLIPKRTLRLRYIYLNPNITMKSVNCSFLKNKNHVATSVREECFSPYTQGFHPGEGNTLVLSGWTLSAPLLSTPRRGLGHSIRQ